MNKKIFDIIDKLKMNEDCYLLQMADGEAAGCACLFVNGFVVTKDPGFPMTVADGFSRDYHKHEAGLYDFPEGRLFVSRIGAKSRLIICGGGHVSKGVILFAKMAGFDVWVIDDREEYAKAAAEAGADRVICNDYAAALSSVPDSMDNYYVCVTRGHKFDMESLLNVIPRPHAYIGMMGSRGRSAIVKNDIKAIGYPAEYVDEIHAPIGLDIGAQTPEEIAISIVAELIQERNKKRKSAVFDKRIINGVFDQSAGRKMLCTIISKAGSGPRSISTRMLVSEKGLVYGTIGGGYAEGVIIKECISKLNSQKFVNAFLMDVNLSTAIAEDEGMICGGSMEVLIQEV